MAVPGIPVQLQDGGLMTAMLPQESCGKCEKQQGKPSKSRQHQFEQRQISLQFAAAWSDNRPMV